MYLPRIELGTMNLNEVECHLCNKISGINYENILLKFGRFYVPTRLLVITLWAIKVLMSCHVQF